MSAGMTPEAVERSMKDIRDDMSQLQDCLGEDPDEDLADTVDMMASEVQAEVDKLVEEGDALTDMDRFDLVEQITDLSAEVASLQERVEAWKRRGRTTAGGSSSSRAQPAPAPAPAMQSQRPPAQPSGWPPPPQTSSSNSWPPQPGAAQPGAGVGGFAAWPPPPPQSTQSRVPSSQPPTQSRAEQEALAELRAASKAPVDSKRLQAAVDKCHRSGVYSPEVSAAEDKLRDEQRKQQQDAALNELDKAIDECETPRLRRAMGAAKQAGVPASALEDGDARLKQLDAAKKLRKDAVSVSAGTCFRAWKDSSSQGKFQQQAESDLEQRIQDGSGADDVLDAALSAKEAGSEESVWQKGMDVAQKRQDAHDQAVCAWVSEELHHLEAANSANQAAGGPKADVSRLQAALQQAIKDTIKTKALGKLSAGATKIDVPSHDGFSVGDTIMIGGKEERTIVAFGSLVLDRPLEHSHAEGVEIRKLKKKAALPPTLLQSPAQRGGGNNGAQLNSTRPTKKVVYNSAPPPSAAQRDDSPVVQVPQRGQTVAPTAGTFGSAPPAAQQPPQGGPPPGYQPYGQAPGGYGMPPPRPQQPPYGWPQQPPPQGFPGYGPPPYGQRPPGPPYGYGQPPPWGGPPPPPPQQGGGGFFGTWGGDMSPRGGTRGIPGPGQPGTWPPQGPPPPYGGPPNPWGPYPPPPPWGEPYDDRSCF
mmetsp:Transcript_11414/g.26380  ORF Transcript_11414/g.26380 Transcript_11414/m.26380 type:complete len:700 (-) Transcript_11414:71-2170(-)